MLGVPPTRTWPVIFLVAVTFVLAGVLASACASSGSTSSVQALCAKDGECRLFSDYCGGCACRALSAGEAEPTCKGTIVQCLVDPCQGKQATCSGGACVVK